MTKFYQEINSHLKVNPHWKPYIGKAKVSKDCNLWAGKWKKILNVSGNHVKLEDNRDFRTTEIEEFRLTQEYMLGI